MDENIDDMVRRIVESAFDRYGAKRKFDVDSFLEKHSHVSPETPIGFDCINNVALQAPRNIVAGHILEKLMDKHNNSNENTFDALYFLYCNYEFVEFNLSKIIEVHEGSICCTDKARYLIDFYVYELLGVKKPVDSGSYTFFIPSMNDFSLWFDYIDTLEFLYCGEFDEYLKLREKVVEKYIEMKQEGGN